MIWSTGVFSYGSNVSQASPLPLGSFSQDALGLWGQEECWGSA